MNLYKCPVCEENRVPESGVICDECGKELYVDDFNDEYCVPVEREMYDGE
jgi:hypothetical protein